MDYQLEYLVDRYGDGECGIFALAMSQLTGLPVVLFRMNGDHGLSMPDRWPRHAAVSLKDGRFLDAEGISWLPEIAARFDASMRVDRDPSLTAFPFESGPGHKHFNEEEWFEAEMHALELLHLRGLLHLAKETEVGRILSLDEDRDYLPAELHAAREEKSPGAS